MDQIASQLRSEIASLSDYIQRTQERMQVTAWLDELLVPFESLEPELAPTELQHVLIALYHARSTFAVNGRLSSRIDAILDRHGDFQQQFAAEPRQTHEELPARDPTPDDGTAEDEEQPEPALNLEAASRFPAPVGPKGRISPEPAQERYARPPAVDIFAHKIRLDELLTRLDITIPSQDRARLQDRLHAKVRDQVMATLQTDPVFEKQLILLPRLSRFVHQGQVYPCTVKNLARTFITLFGDIEDLVQYKGSHILDTQVPEPGWVLIPAEAPAETLNKSHMEQAQYLRHLAVSSGLPSHLVQRRTLVEAVYDSVIAKIVLGQPLPHVTLDWTTTGVGRNDYICMYFSESGIRLRDVPRTTRNPALGTIPTW